MPRRIIKLVRKERYTITIFSLLFLSLLFISNENLLKQFTPRRLCMFGNEKLIGMHLVADLAIGIAYVVLGRDLIMIYRAFKNYHLPWKGYLWMYGGFILLCGLTHWFGVLNLWVTYYWLDGLIKMATAIFSASVAVVFHKDSRSMRNMKSSQEYERLAVAYENLLKQYEQIKELHALDRN